MITKETLVEMFDGMADSTDWDITAPLLWGYFFTDPSKAKLEAASLLLKAQGYRIAELFLGEDDEGDDSDTWYLHVEKVERHDADSLHERNKQLYRFAYEQGLGAYDGMDVGLVDEPPPLKH